jgi:hypothetical protein
MSMHKLAITNSLCESKSPTPPPVGSALPSEVHQAQQLPLVLGPPALFGRDLHVDSQRTDIPRRHQRRQRLVVRQVPPTARPDRFPIPSGGVGGRARRRADGANALESGGQPGLRLECRRSVQQQLRGTRTSGVAGAACGHRRPAAGWLSAD